MFESHRAARHLRRRAVCAVAVCVCIGLSSDALTQPTTRPAVPPPSVPPPSAATPSPRQPALAPAGDDVSIEATAPDDALYVGQPTTLVFDIEHPGYTFDEPVVGALDTGRVRVLGVRHETSTDTDGSHERFEVEVAVYHHGRFYFPPIPFVYADDRGTRRVLKSPRLSIKVASLLAESDEEPQLRAPPGPVTLLVPDTRWSTGLAIGAAALALLALGFLLARRLKRRPKRVTPPPPPRPAWEVALERLQALAEEIPEDEKQRRELYFALSEVIRDYLGARYGFDALEMTTSELLDHLQGIALPRQLERRLLEAFLLDCDLVKFARYPVTPDQAEGDIALARDVVRKTQPFAARPGPSAPSAGGGHGG